MRLDILLLRIPAPLRRLLRQTWGPNFLLLSLLIAALVLRLYGLNWDDGHGFHPDERSFYLRADDMFRALTLAPGHERWLAEWPGMEAGIPDFWTALSAERSPLNPHWFPLGSVLIYALVLIRSIAELFTDWGALDLRFAGRTLAALADTASVWLMYVIGRRMYGRGTGLLAAALTAFAVVHIQHAHYYRPEPFTVLASLAALWAMLRFIDTGRSRDSALLGAMVGLALATKISVAPILAPLALTFLWVCKDRAGGRWSDLTPPAALRFAPTALLAGVTALTVFFITTPYAFLDWSTFVADIRAQGEMAREAGHWPFTWQYADTPAFWYQIRQSAVWGLGLPLGIVAWVAAPFTAWLAWRGGRLQRADLLLLAWAVPAFVFLELFEVKFLRYVFPLLPFYILMAARMLTATISWSRVRRARTAAAARPEPRDAPFSEEWHATPPTVSDDVIFDEPLVGDAPFSEEWHATPPLAGTSVATIAPLAPVIARSAWQSPWRAVRRQAARCAYPASIAALGIVLAATVLYAIAFAGIYSRPHTAVTASQWLNANAPPGASIINAGSLWDERIPDLGRYAVWDFPAYHRPDDDRKIAELTGQLAGADYLIFYSNRAYGAVARLPQEYPRSATFYRQLFAGDLGYRLERAFTSYPSLVGLALRDNPYGRANLPKPDLAPDGEDGQPAGIVINLGYADENVIGYDHPQALVFRNVERLPAGVLHERINNAVALMPDAPPLMLSPSARQAQQFGGTWSELFHRTGWASHIPWLAWLLVIELICLVAFPLTWWLLRPLPDRGLLFARVAGLLLVAWVAWMLINAGVMRYSAGAVWLAMLIVTIPSAVIVWRQWRQMLDWLRGKWQLILTAEALFLLAYFAFLLIRAANPDLWHPWRGGEKPMELAYFTAVARSSVLPPYDPWFSGGYLNYYYWGYYILSAPMRLTGIPPATVFNLAVPLLFALTATGAGSLVYNMVALARNRNPLPSFPRKNVTPYSDTGPESRRGIGWLSRLPGSASVAGLIAAIMATVAANLDGVTQLLQMAQARVQGMPAPLSSFDFWRSSRAIPEIEDFEPSWLTPWLEARDHVETAFHITEFPFFTFLFADLHAHMMTMPFALLALALAFTLLAGLTTSGLRSLWPWAIVALLGLAVGSLWAINSWEYPAYALLMVGITAAAALMLSGPLRTRLLTAGALSGLALLVSYAAFQPFHAATETFGTGIEPARWRTPLSNYLLIHALPLLAAAALLAATLPRAAAPLLARLQDGVPMPAARQWILTAAACGILLAGYFLSAGYATAGFLAVLLTLTGWALAAALTSSEYPTRRPDLMALAMLALALAIGIGVEFIRVEGDIARMNTLFKYYLVAWLLFATSGSYGFWRGWAALSSSGIPSRRKLRWFALSIVGLVALGVLVYPALATPVRIADRFNSTPLTLDGEAWMSRAEYHPPDWCADKPGAPINLQWDYDAIRWLQDNAVGTPVILEAHGSQYCWNSRFSQYTGLPTVIGWPWHQTQQRNDGDAVRQRGRDVAAIYNSRSQRTALDLLDDYDVAYIVVGDLERLYYLPDGIAKFDLMVDNGTLGLAYANRGTKIYEVKKTETW